MSNHQPPRPFAQLPLALRVAIYLIALSATLLLLRETRVVVAPVLLALFLALLGAPVMRWLRARRVPTGMSAVIVVLGMTAMLVLTILIITSSLQTLSSRAPVYQRQFEDQLNLFFGSGDELSLRTLIDTIDPGSGVRFLAGLLTEALAVVGNLFIILIVAAFMLIEGATFAEKLSAALGASPQREQRLQRFSWALARYAGIKSVMSILTGLLVGLFAWAVGLDLALLLGFLAFVLNYIPNIGSAVAALPGLLLAFVQLGPGGFVVVGIGYLAINNGVSNVLEPRLMGQGLGLSPLVVFLSVLAGGWVLGPVGVVLSVPLVMALQLALEANPSTRRLAYLLQSIGSVRADAEAAAKGN